MPPGGGVPGPLPPGLTPGGGGPGGGWIPVGAGAAPVAPSPAPAAGGGRRALSVIGIVLIVAGIGAAIALAVAGTQRYADGVDKLARGPANCVTTLEVDADATFYFYVETAGEIADVRGDCPALGREVDVDGDAGRVRLTLQDDDRESVRLRRADGISYDAGGHQGELVRTAELGEGRYHLTVEADEDVVVAIGRDVEGLKASLVLPIVVGVAGVVLGVVALVSGRRTARSLPRTPPPAAAGPGGFVAPPVGQQPPGWTAPPAPRG